MNLTLYFENVRGSHFSLARVCRRARFATASFTSAKLSIQRRMTWRSLKDPSDTHGRLIAASKVNGTSVYNLTGAKLGSIYDVMLSKESGRAEYAIMSFGGFLGIGKKFHPLPWHVLTYSPEQDGYVIELGRRRLEGAPSYAVNTASPWDGRLRSSSH